MVRELEEKERMRLTHESQVVLQEQQRLNQLSVNEPHLREQQDMMESILIKSLDPANVIDHIELTLRGEYKDYEGRILKKSDSVLNDVGVGKILVLLRGVLNINTTISSLDKRTVQSIMQQIQKDLVIDLQLNWREYGIKQKSDLDLINNVVLIPIYTCLCRSMNSGERNFLSRSVSDTLNSNTPTPFKNEGGIKRFMNRFRL